MEDKLQRMIKDGEDSTTVELMDRNGEVGRYRVRLSKINTYLEEDYSNFFGGLSADEVAHVLMCEANENYPSGDISPSEAESVVFALEELIDAYDDFGFDTLTKTVLAIVRKYAHKWI